MTENQRIKEAREYFKLSQVQFAESLGLKQGSYSAIESGRVGISGSVLALLNNKYRISIPWIKFGQGEMLLPEGSKPPDFTINGISSKQIENIGAIELELKETKHKLELAEEKVRQLEARLKDKEDYIELLKRNTNP